MAQSSSLTCKMPMHKKAAIIFWVVCVLVPSRPLRGEDTVQSAAGTIKTDVVTIRVQRQHELVRPGSKSAIAVHFELKKDWHFYASAETAPGQMNIKINPILLWSPTIQYIQNNSTWDTSGRRKNN